MTCDETVDTERGGEGSHSTPRRHLALWQETLVLIGIALVLAIVIKALFVQAFYIPSESMEPGLIENDRILVQKVSYWFDGEPERGDVVVFKDPGGWLADDDAAMPSNPLVKGMAKVGLYPEGGHLVKRVIGVGGDRIECCDEQGRLLVNGTPLDEGSYVPPQESCNGPMPSGRLTCDWTIGPVPDGYLFVMGDNRAHSSDSSARLCSRSKCGAEAYVPVDNVVGRVFVLLWPLDRFTTLETPATFADIPGSSARKE